MRKIVGFGDSLTYGYLVNNGYLDYLKNLIKSDKWKIINSGIPGDTVIDGLHRINRSVLQYNPDITIVEFALNDAFSNISVPKFEEIYLKILSMIGNIKIIMIPHVSNDKYIVKTSKPYYFTLKKISQDLKLPLIDLSEYTFGKNELLGDNLHPNENGYKIYAKETYKVIKSIVE